MSQAFRNPALTVDGIIFDQNQKRIILIKRKNEPFRNCWALPGGFVDYGEAVEKACQREILEETGLVVDEIRLFGVYSEPDRDPRGHTVSIVFIVPFVDLDTARPADDAADISILRISELPGLDLAFDHNRIICDFLSTL